MKRKKKILVFAVMSGVVLASACGSDAAKKDTTTVVEEKVDTSITLDGTVMARNESVIFAKDTCRVTKIQIQTGDHVEKKDVLVEYKLIGEMEDSKVKKISCDLPEAIVTSLELVEGQTLQEGAPLMTLAECGQYYIQTEILENFISDIQVDEKVTIIPNADKTKEFTGTITKIDPYAYVNDKGDNVIRAEVSLDEQDELLSLGYTVRVKVASYEE